MRTTTDRRRRTTIRERRVRCRICGTREAKRFCPAVGIQKICPSCCLAMRGKRAECQTCRYNLIKSVFSWEIPRPDAKFHTAMVSDSEKAGMMDLVIAWEKSNGRLSAMFFLLDFWKKGMKDCFMDSDISKEEFQQKCANLGGRGAKKISFDEAKKLVKRGLYISKAIGTPIPWDYQHWQNLLGNISNVPDPAGSLYKCARCGGELREPVIEVMKKHAQLEDAHFYIVCEKCAGEFED